MLKVDPDERPDIYQVSYVAFRLARRDIPVQNLHVRAIMSYLHMFFILSTCQGHLKYSRTCYEQPPLGHLKSGLSRPVAAHRRFICI